MAEHEEGTTPEAAAPTLTPSQVSGRTFRRYNLAALACGAAALAAGAPWALSGEGAQVAAHDPLGFARDARWDDGKAEVARYTAQRTIYGSPRDFELIRIAVKEPFDPAQRVKPDADRPGVLSAIKTVAVHEVPCGRAYTYRQQLICRLAQADPRRLLDRGHRVFALTLLGDHVADEQRRQHRAEREGPAHRPSSASFSLPSLTARRRIRSRTRACLSDRRP